MPSQGESRRGAAADDVASGKPGPAAGKPARTEPSKRVAPPRKAAASKAPRKSPAGPRKTVTVTTDPSPMELLDAALAKTPPPVVAAATVPTATATASRRNGRGRAVAVSALALILAAAAGLSMAAWNESRPDTYASQAVLLIDQEPALTFATDGGLLAKLGSLRIKYADTVRTTTFARYLSGQLGVAPGPIHASLSAQVPPASLLLGVTSTSTDRRLPQLVANAAATTLADDLSTAQRLEGVPVRQRVTLTVVSPATPSVLTSPSRRRSLELGAGAFGAVLLGAALLYDLTRRRQPADGTAA